MFAAVFVCLLLFAVFEVAFALYARNVVASSAHEAARAAIELQASAGDAQQVAQQTVVKAAGGLVRQHRIVVSTQRGPGRVLVGVRVTGKLDAPGPLPIQIPVDVTATASRGELP